MKKILAAAFAVLLLTSACAALSIGARASWNLGLGDSSEEEASNNKANGNMGGGAAAYVNFGILKIGSFGFGLQPEVDLNFNNGINYVASASIGKDIANVKTTVTAHTNTIDIPLLLTFDLPVTPAFTIGVGAGPMVSFPFEADNTTTTSGNLLGLSSNGTTNISDIAAVKGNMTFGTALDAHAKFNLGSLLRIVLDMRCNIDLTPTEFTQEVKNNTVTTEAFTRRSINIGLGVEVGL